MKVLFVVSGNKESLSPIFQNQYDSLKPYLSSTKIFQISGKGLSGYLKNIWPLRKVLKEYNPDLVHAHYSFCGIISSLAGSKRTVVSLMGSDVKDGGIFKIVIRLFKKYNWDVTIVKSRDMIDNLGKGTFHIIPNGVNLSLFKPLDQNKCRSTLLWNIDQVHLLFAADSNRPEKNFELFKNSADIIRERYPNMVVHTLKQVPKEKVPLYYNAANVVCLSSRWEGSPNVVKEAMACNRPVLSTNVGDVQSVFGKKNGCFISKSQNVAEYSAALQKALLYTEKRELTDGRSRIYELGLDSESVAKKIISIYNEVLN